MASHHFFLKCALPSCPDCSTGPPVLGIGNVNHRQKPVIDDVGWRDVRRLPRGLACIHHQKRNRLFARSLYTLERWPGYSVRPREAQFVPSTCDCIPGNAGKVDLRATMRRAHRSPSIRPQNKAIVFTYFSSKWHIITFGICTNRRNFFRSDRRAFAPQTTMPAVRTRFTIALRFSREVWFAPRTPPAAADTIPNESPSVPSALQRVAAPCAYFRFGLFQIESVLSLVKAYAGTPRAHACVSPRLAYFLLASSCCFNQVRWVS